MAQFALHLMHLVPQLLLFPPEIFSLLFQLLADGSLTLFRRLASFASRFLGLLLGFPTLLFRFPPGFLGLPMRLFALLLGFSEGLFA